MDPAHMEMMAEMVRRGRYLYCPHGSHMAIYDDQQIYMAKPTKFVHIVLSHVSLRAGVNESTMKQEISVNATLAHYRIVEKLGAGGMGEVYRARDTRLDREVAIKVLLADYAQDVDWLNRFE